MQMRGLGERRDEIEAPSMLQRGNARTGLRHLRRIDLRHHDPGLVAAFGQHASPWIDDERMAEGLAAVLMPAPLRCGEDKAAVLDRAGPYKYVPMRFAGLLG